MTVVDLLQRHRDEVLRLAERHGATNVRLFGSGARGAADDASDFDLIVSMAPGASVFDLGSRIMDREDLLGRPADVVTDRGRRDRGPAR